MADRDVSAVIVDVLSDQFDAPPRWTEALRREPRHKARTTTP